MPPDLILTNGRVYTMDGRGTVADAMAVCMGRVAAVGPRSEVEGLARPGTRRIDLRKRTVVPGLIDSHLHLLSFGATLTEVSLHGVPSVEEAVARVREAASGARSGAWIRGSGWDRNLFGRLPTRQDLDAAAPNNPVLLASKDLHALWVSSSALDRAGIRATTPDPPNGEIIRDTSGHPTGILTEAARAPLFAAVPAPAAVECEAAVLEALKVAAAKGLTGVQTFESVDTFRALRSLRTSERLRVRVCCHLWKEGLDGAIALGLGTGFGDAHLSLGHVKLFLDGSLGSQTALMLAPYAGSQGRGVQVTSRDEFRDLVLRAAQAGIATAVHAIGDAANRIAIDVLAETAPAWQKRGLRQRIEHVQLLAPGDEARLARLGIIASMQPIHATSDWEIAERHWAGRTHLAYAWRSLFDAGATLAFGSDCPVESIDPLLGMYAAVTRRTAEGQPTEGWHPEQTLTPLEALRAYTLGAASSTGQEGARGSLEVRKLADFVVLSNDPFSGPPELFLETRVDATVAGGEVIHGEL